mgnify:CR=1 FL=1
MRVWERRQKRVSAVYDVPTPNILLANQTLSSLTIAITGTNSGIGQSAARQLLEQGHEIIHACRDEAAGKTAAVQATKAAIAELAAVANATPAVAPAPAAHAQAADVAMEAVEDPPVPPNPEDVPQALMGAPVPQADTDI